MSVKIQTYVSDKNIEKISELIQAHDFVDYEGNYMKTKSAVCSYLIDLGLRVHVSSKDKTHFNLSDFRFELFKRVLQTLQVSKITVDILNELPEFKNRNLLNECFNQNKESIAFIETNMEKFFVKDE